MRISVCFTKIFTEGRFQSRQISPPILHLSFTKFYLWHHRLRSRGHTNFLDKCFKRKYISKRMDIRDLLEKADSKLFKVCSFEPDCPLSNINILKKKETKCNLRNPTAHRPENIYSDRFKTVFVNRLIFKYNI